MVDVRYFLDSIKLRPLLFADPRAALPLPPPAPLREDPPPPPLLSLSLPRSRSLAAVQASQHAASQWGCAAATSHLCGNQIFNPTSMCAYATVSMQAFRFENSTRAIDPSKNQPNRLRCDRAREVLLDGAFHWSISTRRRARRPARGRRAPSTACSPAAAGRRRRAARRGGARPRPRGRAGSARPRPRRGGGAPRATAAGPRPRAPRPRAARRPPTSRPTGDRQGSKRVRNSQLQRLISRPFSTRFG